MLFLYKKKNNNVNTKRADKGSVTLETVIGIPIFISVILSISLLLKVIYTYEVIQNAISLTANELSTYTYLYHLSGIEGINNKLHQKIGEVTDEIVDEITDEITGEMTGEITGEISGGFTGIQFPDELKDIVYSFIKEAYDDSISQLCIPLTKICVKKHLAVDGIKNPDERLRALSVAGGFDGLDFSMSEFFEDDTDTISIVVRYKINIPTPVRILPSLVIIQKASVRGWLGGDGKTGESKDKERQEDIWSLDNFTRGRKIRDIFGANLPFTFPVIARFDHSSGTAAMIKSMDLTLEYYQNPDIVSKKVKDYINEMKEYKGQEVPWGRDRIIIRNDSIAKRQLTLVIPGNAIVSAVEEKLDQCRLFAENNGVNLNVVRYGFKQAIDDGEDAANEEAGEKQTSEESDEIRE